MSRVRTTSVSWYVYSFMVLKSQRYQYLAPEVAVSVYPSRKEYSMKRLKRLEISSNGIQPSRSPLLYSHCMNPSSAYLMTPSTAAAAAAEGAAAAAAGEGSAADAAAAPGEGSTADAAAATAGEGRSPSPMMTRYGPM